MNSNLSKKTSAIYEFKFSYKKKSKFGSAFQSVFFCMETCTLNWSCPSVIQIFFSLIFIFENVLFFQAGADGKKNWGSSSGWVMRYQFDIHFLKASFSFVPSTAASPHAVFLCRTSARRHPPYFKYGGGNNTVLLHSKLRLFFDLKARGYICFHWYENCFF